MLTPGCDTLRHFLEWHMSRVISIFSRLSYNACSSWCRASLCKVGNTEKYTLDMDLSFYHSKYPELYGNCVSIIKCVVDVINQYIRMINPFTNWQLREAYIAIHFAILNTVQPCSQRNVQIIQRCYLKITHMSVKMPIDIILADGFLTDHEILVFITDATSLYATSNHRWHLIWIMLVFSAGLLMHVICSSSNLNYQKCRLGDE